MSTEAIGGTAEGGGFSVSSNHESPADIKAALVEPSEGANDGDTPDLSKAASELGKKGGEAAAAKRAEAREAAEAATAGDGVEAKEAPQVAEERRKGNPRHDPQARVAQATREAAEAKREAAAAREESARVRAELEQARSARQAQEPAQAPREQPHGKPKVDDYESYNDFVEASIEYRLQQEYARASEHAQQRERLKAQDEFEGKFSASIQKAAKADPEFHGRVSPEIIGLEPVHAMQDPRRATGRNWLASEIIASAEDAPAIMLHLSEYPNEFQRIAALSTPHAVTREIAKLVNSLEVETTANNSKPTVSKASPPVRPVTGTPLAADPTDVSDDLSFEDHVRRMNARERAAHRR